MAKMMAGVKGAIRVDEKKFKYMVSVEFFNEYKGEWMESIVTRTNDIKRANREMKRLENQIKKFHQESNHRNLKIYEN